MIFVGILIGILACAIVFGCCAERDVLRWHRKIGRWLD